MQLPAIFQRAPDAVIGPSGEIVARSAVSAMGVDGWWQWQPPHEPYAGAFQQGYMPDRQEAVLAFSAVFACVSLIANDIAKLRIKFCSIDEHGIWTEAKNAAYSPVLRKPNRYQTRIQFLVQWLLSKLLAGNAYVLLERDGRGGEAGRGNVVRMHVLDPRRTRPLVTESGDVYYELDCDNLAGLTERDDLVVPASEIIHDRGITPYHPLCGVSPIFACAMSSSQGNRIQSQAMRFAANAGRPSGVITAPRKIDTPTAERIKQTIEAATTGANVGRLLVLGDGQEYKAFDMMSFVDSQLVEQLQWTVEDVARAFQMPLSKLGASSTAGASGKADAQDDLFYYKQTLQVHIEAIELLLEEGLGLDATDKPYGIELDLDGLLRMDPKARAETDDIRVKSGTMKPDEARARENLPPVSGGDACYMQMQNFSLAALAKRDAREDPFATSGKEAPAAPPAEPAKDAPAVVERAFDLDAFAEELEAA